MLPRLDSPEKVAPTKQLLEIHPCAHDKQQAQYTSSANDATVATLDAPTAQACSPIWQPNRRCTNKAHSGHRKYSLLLTASAMYLSANNDMVATRMDGHAGDASRASDQLLRQSLLGQVVHSDMVLCGHKQEGLQGVEQHPYHTAPVLPEGVLCGVLRELVYQHCLSVACTVTPRVSQWRHQNSLISHTTSAVLPAA